MDKWHDDMVEFHQKKYDQYPTIKQQKQYQKHYQKIKQPEASGWSQEELPFDHYRRYDNFESTRPVSPDELDTAFWNTLVHLGWRKSQRIKEQGEEEILVLVCLICDRTLNVVTVHGMTVTELKTMSDSKKIQARIKSHQESRCEEPEDTEFLEEVKSAKTAEEIKSIIEKYDEIHDVQKVLNKTLPPGLSMSIERNEEGKAISFSVDRTDVDLKRYGRM